MIKLFFFLKVLPKHVWLTFQQFIWINKSWSDHYNSLGEPVPELHVREEREPIAFNTREDYTFMLDKFMLWLPKGAWDELGQSEIDYLFTEFVENERGSSTARH